MSDAPSSLLRSTALLDFDHPDIERLVVERGWRTLPMQDRIGAVYDFVRNEIAFGYNEADDRRPLACWPMATVSATPRARC